MEKLTCTKVVTRNAGRDHQGRPITYHEQCGSPASEVEIGGILGKAKAVLCVTHQFAADDEAFVSVNGFRKDKISKAAKEKGYQQLRLPGTGVIKQS